MPQLITRQYEKQTQIMIFFKIQRQLITFFKQMRTNAGKCIYVELHVNEQLSL